MQDKPFVVCAEIEGDEDHYRPVSRHSSEVAAERAARKYELERGITTWVDGPDIAFGSDGDSAGEAGRAWFEAMRG